MVKLITGNTTLHVVGRNVGLMTHISIIMLLAPIDKELYPQSLKIVQQVEPTCPISPYFH